MNFLELSESRELVDVPGVGPMVRVEVRSTEGELLEIQYRWPSESQPQLAPLMSVAIPG